MESGAGGRAPLPKRLARPNLPPDLSPLAPNDRSCICRFAARPPRGRSRSVTSARASTGSSPRTPANRAGSRATKTCATCIGCARCATPSSSAPGRSPPTIPQLTTRLVEGPNPLRVVLDPTRRLGEDHRVFNDPSAETLYVCARSLTRPGEDRFGRAVVVGVEDDADGGVDVAELMRLLRARGCPRVFVEGGGVTVSMFLEANLLDRLHVAIAPLLIGDGRPAIRLPPPRRARRLPSAALPRVPHGRRRAVRLRSQRGDDEATQPETSRRITPRDSARVKFRSTVVASPPGGHAARSS